MATGPLAPVVHYLRQVTSHSALSELPDAELLARFARQGDETAFTALVRRHGPMVLGVCRRLVRDGHAAEDALQATFLVLARKADSLAQPELLAHWLYGVAYRTAKKARREAARRHVHESQAVRAEAVDPSEEIDRQDLGAIVDEEINRLPERYRVPVVLCYLQGQTNAEAARHLGCSRGTIATLLARARDKLRRRLTQRGIGLAVGAALGALAPTVQSGTVSLALVNVTVKAAMLLSAGQAAAVAALAAQAVALAKGVSKGMLIEKLRIPAAILIVTAMVGTGAGVSAYRAGVPDPDVVDSTTEAEPGPQNKPEEQRKHVSAPAGLPKTAKTTIRTANFVVTAPTLEIAREVGEAAEHNRKALARLWLGKELPTWSEPCPIRVTVTDYVGSATEFSFDYGVVSRKMFLEGPLDRTFADSLPHEITHTILAEWRGRSLPRWADEGAAMLSESAISREKHEQAMKSILRTGRPRPLTELLPRLDFPKDPKDVMAFYAQSFSLTDFLVTVGGRKKFLSFVAKGADETWNTAAELVYGFKSVEALEQAWLAHARQHLAVKESVEPSHPRQAAEAVRDARQPNARPAPSFKERLPQGAAPVQALVIVDEDGRLTVCRKNSLYRPVQTPVTQKEGASFYVTTYQQIDSETKYYFKVESVRVHDAKGRKIETQELRKRLQNETVALFSADGGPVDPLHLRLYKEDTLVFVLPSPPPPEVPGAVHIAPLAVPPMLAPLTPDPFSATPIPADHALPDAVPPPPPVVKPVQKTSPSES